MIATKQKIVAAFDRATDYDSHADVQRGAASDLARSIGTLDLPRRPRVLEFGCGTGFLAEAAMPLLPEANWLMTDIAPDMVERSRRRLAGDPRFRFAQLDAEAPELPGDEAGFDLVCSNLTAQWFDDVAATCERLIGLAKPGGVLLFSTLAAGTFREWEQAHRDLGRAPGLRPLPRPETLRALRPGRSPGEVTLQSSTVRHADARAFLHSLRSIGAATPHAQHRPLHVGAMRAVMRRFEAAGAEATYVIATCRFRRPPDTSA